MCQRTTTRSSSTTSESVPALVSFTEERRLLEPLEAEVGQSITGESRSRESRAEASVQAEQAACRLHSARPRSAPPAKTPRHANLLLELTAPPAAGQSQSEEQRCVPLAGLGTLQLLLERSQASQETWSLQHVLGLPQGLPSVEHAQNTSLMGDPEQLLMSWFLLTWRSSGSTPSSSSLKH
ncbi:hypothetical protein WMY93_020107 [Mugilogobius chulae]|uniref:Uncharacterized protein n=1 Tax=Mugilogobius chulae TaxID=88201 RepID=A0AAW0NTL9_9GOBI